MTDSITKTTVTGILRDQGGTPLSNTVIYVTLDRPEVDNGYVIPKALRTVTDAEGAFSIALWPNESGVNGSFYRFNVLDGKTGKQTLSVQVVVPAVETVRIEDIEVRTPYPPVSAAESAMIAAQSSAANAEQDRVQTQADRVATGDDRSHVDDVAAVVDTDKGIIKGYKDDAAISNHQAGIARTGSEDAQAESEAARDRSQEWAENPEGSEVVLGSYSALHHAAQSQASANDSADSAAAASASESASASSEQEATDQATAAQTARTGAETAESGAVAARDAAQTAESGAQSAETGAINAKNEAEDIFLQFGSQYLGPHAEDPIVDNEGDPLTEGDVYFNTTNDYLKFYSGTSWVAPENVASTAASEAKDSETAAAGSASAASTSEANASNSETAAAVSETNAAGSESAAASSEAASASARDAAQLAETGAKDAETGANAALDTLEDEVSQAEAARDAAQVAESGSVSAKDDSELARDEAQAAAASVETGIEDHANETDGVHGIPLGEDVVHTGNLGSAPENVPTNADLGIPEDERAIHSEELRAAVSEAADTAEAVSMTGKGAIVESGSNSNGHYVRWENGEQVCFCSLSNGLTASATADLGSELYRSRTLDDEQADWSFPVSFSSAPTLQVGQVARNPGWASARSSTNDGASFLLYTSSEDNDIGISASAWGFWK